MGKLLAGDPEAAVTGSIMHHPVTDTALASRCSKPVCMACNPIGQEASIGAAGDTDPGPGQFGIYVQNMVRKLHQVIIVQGSVDAGDCRIGHPVAVASPGITEEYKVTPPLAQSCISW